MMKRTHIHAVAVVVAVSALAVAATAAAGGAAESTGDRTGGERASIRGIPQPLPAIARAQVKDLPGADPSQSMVAVESPLGSVYLTPTAGGACISLVRPGLGAGLTCGTQPATLLEGCRSPAPGTPPTCEGATVYGVVPDGVDRVAVTKRDGRAVASEHVTNGVYLLNVSLDSAPAALQFEQAGDQIRQPLPFVGLAD